MRATVSIIFLIFVIVFIWWYLFWKTRRARKLIANLRGPPVLPFLGNALEFVGNNKDITSALLDLPKKYPPPLRLWMGNSLCIAITHPPDVQTLLNSKSLNRPSEYNNALIPILRRGLVTSTGSVWKNHRRLMMPTFNKKILESFVEVFSEQSEILVEKLIAEVGNEPFDFYKYASSCTLASICETIMGVKINAQEENCPFLYWINSALEIAMKRIFQVWLRPDFIFNLTPYAKRQRELVEKAQCLVTDVIKMKKEEYYLKYKERHEDMSQQVQEDPRRKSILDVMIEMSTNGSGFTDEELRDEVTTMIAAGSDTTTLTIGFALVMLGLHPQYQEKVYQEVIDVLGPDRKLEHTDLKNFVYTDMVLKETLRLYPVGPMLGRVAESDIRLESFTVPAGSVFLIHILTMHRNPDIFPDPLKFDPDRFLPEEIAKRHPYSWIPFAAGPRNCIGLNYGMMQMKTILAYLVRRYKFTTPYESIEKFEIRADLLLKPLHGYLISIEPRG